MCYSLPGRRAVAITAAYALALHALLAAFVAPQAAASALVSIVCFGAGSADDHDSGLPASHAPECVVCAASGCAVVPPVDTAIRVAVTAERDSHALDVRLRRVACSGPARSRAQSPRAPPVLT